MDELKVTASFVEDVQKRLLLTYEVLYKNKRLSLQLSELMQFLYANKRLSEPSQTFLYYVSRVTKKFSYKAKLVYGIKNDDDILHFFLKVKKSNIPIVIKENNKQQKLSFNQKLPISIVVEQSGYKLICKLINKSFLKKHPTNFLFLIDDSLIYLYSKGVLRKINKSIYDFINKLFDEGPVCFDETETTTSFLKSVYRPNSDLLKWEVIGNLDFLIPQEITPNALLTLNYDGTCLQPLLSYEYGKEIIESTYKDNDILDRETGKIMARLPKMEDIFQQDLMYLFEQQNIPFLLTSPGDIAKFFETVVPELKDRGWKVNSNVDDFTVMDDPVTLDFEISTSSNDWFYFEPSCDVLGQNVSLQELSRLMVDNQGYVKTKKGYAKISKSTQEEIKLLSQMGAFKVGKTFSKKEMMPLMMMTKTKSNHQSVKGLISQINSFDISKTVLSNAFQGELRPYQHYGVHWMNLLSNIQLGGILADDMGLGKTVQTLAYTSLNHVEGTTLVVCPTTVLFNWKREIEKFLKNKKVFIYQGPTRQESLIRMDKYDYVIISYGILKNDIELLKNISFKSILADEAQAIKNPQAQVSKAIKRLQGQFKLVMTGTPIENHLQDIWNLFDFIMPNYLGNKNQFDELIKSSDRTMLRAKIKPFVLRREKKEVLESLPEKTEITLECPLSDQQMQLYKTVLDAAKKGVQVSKNQRNKLNMLSALLRLRQVCTHPGLIKDFKDLSIESAKFEMLKQKCEQLIDEGHKVVVFSQFTSMLDIIQKWIEEKNIKFERIDGTISGKKRMDAVDRFQDGKDPMLFIISLKAGGVGLNLTAADYVIHIDPWWNPAIEAQATDRVHRMGQKNKVIVYKLICAGTIEEKINQLQNEKKQLLSEIVDIDSSSEKKLDFDQIKSLILE